MSSAEAECEEVGSVNKAFLVFVPKVFAAHPPVPFFQERSVTHSSTKGDAGSQPAVAWNRSVRMTLRT